MITLKPMLFLTALLLCLGLTGCEDTVSACAEKPVIYLYPEETRPVTVELSLTGTLTCSYPPYEGRWQVTATPEGLLTDADGREYNSLFWEGLISCNPSTDQGFVIPGEDTRDFLEESLSTLGLTDREAGDFITYWLPRMQDNPYNLISFETAQLTEAAELHVTPEPDSVIRVFMTFRPLDEPISIPEQALISPQRTGFTVVEWGGMELS